MPPTSFDAAKSGPNWTLACGKIRPTGDLPPSKTRSLHIFEFIGCCELEASVKVCLVVLTRVVFLAQRIIGKSGKTGDLLNLLRAVAPDEASILITGESGSGKELVAQEIHRLSHRADKAFVAVNCGAIPAELLESELFGHKKGAFTGAISDRIGKIQAAHEGTLFLDEIGDMPLEMQVKLLRVLQEKVINPVGSNSLVKVDIRVISATHRDLDEEIKGERFRSDLYFRLNVIPVRVAPLRDRITDLVDLIDFFSQQFSKNGNPIEFQESLLSVVKQYDWPGNVRELSNMVHRLSVLYPGESLSVGSVDASMLPQGMIDIIQSSADFSSIQDPQGAESQEQNDIESIVMQAQGYDQFRRQGSGLKEMLSEIEKDIIVKALGDMNGNVSKCAKLLSMQRTTLIERIKRYDLRASQ